jgi:hypothetical protein
MKTENTQYNKRLMNIINTIIKKAKINNNQYLPQILDIISYGLKIQYNSRLKSTFAEMFPISDYNIKGCIIYYGDLLFSPNISSKTRKDIMAHELAHWIDYLLRGNTWHDSAWKTIHISLGGSGQTKYAI